MTLYTTPKERATWKAIVLAVVLIAVAIASKAQRLDSVERFKNVYKLYLGDTVVFVHPKGAGRVQYHIGAYYTPVKRHGRWEVKKVK